jgi:hypothetical protein
LFSTGLYSAESLGKELSNEGFTTREGKRIGKSTMHELLKNPFYYGEMISKGKKFRTGFLKSAKEYLNDEHRTNDEPSTTKRNFYSKALSIVRLAEKNSAIMKRRASIISGATLVKLYTKEKMSLKSKSDKS